MKGWVLDEGHGCGCRVLDPCARRHRSGVVGGDGVLSWCLRSAAQRDRTCGVMGACFKSAVLGCWGPQLGDKHFSNTETVSPAPHRPSQAQVTLPVGLRKVVPVGRAATAETSRTCSDTCFAPAHRQVGALCYRLSSNLSPLPGSTGELSGRASRDRGRDAGRCSRCDASSPALRAPAVATVTMADVKIASDVTELIGGCTTAVVPIA